MKVAVQMDPISHINLDSDSTICLIKEAIFRGFSVYQYTPKNLKLKNSGLFADVCMVSVVDDNIILSDSKSMLLEEFDVLLMRQDPPVDMHYLTYTHMLDHVKDKVLIVNNPTSVRDMPEKLFALSRFSKYMPETIVLEDTDDAVNFLSAHEDVIVKPLYGYGGEGIKKFNNKHKNEFKNYFNKLLSESGAPVMLQKFLANVARGDKRVILIDGKVVGAINRVPPKDSFRANMVLGGIPKQTSLTEQEKTICENVGKELKLRHIIFAGLDIIDGFLTEINITSPTGIHAINKLEGLVGDNKIECKIWNVIHQKLDEI